MSAIDGITICDDEITIENLIAALEEGADLIEKVGISESLSRDDMQKRLVEHNRNIAHLLKVAYRKKRDEWQTAMDSRDAVEYSLLAATDKKHMEWLSNELQERLMLMRKLHYCRIDERKG